MRHRLQEEVITDEQRELEEQGWYFLGNIGWNNRKARDAQIARDRKGFSGYTFGNAYDMHGNTLPESRAMYVRP